MILAGGLEVLVFLEGGRLERAWDRDGGTRLLGAGVGARGVTGGIFGREFLGLRGFGGIL